MSVMLRFLAYSLRYQRPVKCVWLTEEGTLKSGNLTVTRLDAEEFSYLTARNRKTPQTMRLDLMLSAAYARGDDGDTAKNEPRDAGKPDET